MARPQPPAEHHTAQSPKVRHLIAHIHNSPENRAISQHTVRGRSKRAGRSLHSPCCFGRDRYHPKMMFHARAGPHSLARLQRATGASPAHGRQQPSQPHTQQPMTAQSCHANAHAAGRSGPSAGKASRSTYSQPHAAGAGGPSTGASASASCTRSSSAVGPNSPAYSHVVAASCAPAMSPYHSTMHSAAVSSTGAARSR